MRFIVVLIFSFIAFSSLAQEATIEGVSPRGFSGVHTFYGEYYYTFFFGEKAETKGMANFLICIFDKNLKEVKRTEIEISKGSELAASSFNGYNFLFVFADMMKKKRTMVTLDKAGNILKQNVEDDVRMSMLVPENYPMIMPLTGDEFLLIRPEKEKKVGYEVEKINKDLVVTYTKPFFPEKGSWGLEDCKIMNDKVFILRSEKAALLSEKYQYTVQCLNIATGDQVYATSLMNDDDGGFPDFIQVDGDGVLATGGMYFANGKYDEKNSDGLFFALINADGSIGKFNKTPWKKVKEQIKGDFSSDIFGGRTKVLIEDVIRKKDGNYMIIGETWRKSNDASNTGMGALTKFGGLGGSSSSGNSGDKGFTLMDFCFFNMDANGNLTSIDRVEKTTKEAVIQGQLAKEGGLAMAQALYRRRFFCYRNVVSGNGKQYIMYKNDDGLKTRAYFLPLGSTSTTSIANIDMSKWVSDDLNKLGKISKALNGNKYTFGNEGPFTSNPELYKNIIPATPGKVFLYQMYGNKLSMWLENIPE